MGGSKQQVGENYGKLFRFRFFFDRGLPLITYAPRGGGGVNTNAYKCVQGGRGGLKMPKNTHFVRRLIKNATISETF